MDVSANGNTIATTSDTPDVTGNDQAEAKKREEIYKEIQQIQQSKLQGLRVQKARAQDAIKDIDNNIQQVEQISRFIGSTALVSLNEQEEELQKKKKEEEQKVRILDFEINQLENQIAENAGLEAQKESEAKAKEEDNPVASDGAEDQDQ